MRLELSIVLVVLLSMLGGGGVYEPQSSTSNLFPFGFGNLKISSRGSQWGLPSGTGRGLVGNIPAVKGVLLKFAGAAAET